MKIKSKKAEYNAKEFFESWHRSSSELSDRLTISPNFSHLGTKYHYNMIENSIIEFFYQKDVSEDIKVLDIGSGSGHWIDYYLTTFKASRCFGIDISEPCIEILEAKYHETSNVEVMAADISHPSFSLSDSFDIINAIGVMFHIVNDVDWLTALQNLSRHLDPEGTMIIGGEFGDTTKDVQFHMTDNFNSWEERQESWDKFSNTATETVLVNKRVRSLSDWRKISEKCGLRIVTMLPSNKRVDIKTPENNLLFLQRE